MKKKMLILPEEKSMAKKFLILLGCGFILMWFVLSTPLFSADQSMQPGRTVTPAPVSQ